LWISDYNSFFAAVIETISHWELVFSYLDSTRLSWPWKDSDSRLLQNAVSEMSSRTPKEVRIGVLFQWMQGTTRDDIAKKVGIAAGTVSEIIAGY
jgi:DNA-directed RNA polymerase specialized sigma24 family protein